MRNEGDETLSGKQKRRKWKRQRNEGMSEGGKKKRRMEEWRRGRRENWAGRSKYYCC